MQIIREKERERQTENNCHFLGEHFSSKNLVPIFKSLESTGHSVGKRSQRVSEREREGDD